MQYGLLRKGKRVATSQNLEGMKLIELKELAKQMGLRGTSTMRKPELVATLQAARSDAARGTGRADSGTGSQGGAQGKCTGVSGG